MSPPRVCRRVVLVGSIALALMPFSSTAIAAPPGEVTGLQVGADKETISWSAEPGATYYNLYRGYLHELAPDFFGTAFEAELALTSVVEPTEPFVERGFFYIVTAGNSSGEGELGDGLDPGGAPSARPNNYAWPGFDVAGSWDGLRSWPDVPIHSTVVSTGEVLTWKGGVNPTTTHTWDPASDTFQTATVPTDIFCAGHSFLADGRLMVSGGTIPLFNGPPETWIYDPSTVSWSQSDTMKNGRYYPSLVTLDDGEILAVSGNKEDGALNGLVERFRTNGQGRWVVLSGATQTMTLYPALHLLPDGTVFRSGPEVNSQILDPATEVWSFVANSNYGKRAGNSGEFNSVMLPPGHEKILILGGKLPGQTQSTNTAEVIDLSGPTPSWGYVAPMRFPRMHSNATILPDGTVFVSGGGYDEDTTSYPAEIYDPATGAWSVVATMRSFRLYHSTAVLLPDGRVMQGGSTVPENNSTVEFYSPGYLFKGPRPTITSAPSSVGYGASFTVDTPDAPAIQSVVWIRLGTATHSKNFSQRYVSLAFTAGATTLNVTAEADARIAPPGYYMLFILDTGGVPSEAAIMQVQ